MLLLPCLKLRQLTVFDQRQTHIICNIIYLKIVCTTWSVLTEQIEAPHLICLLLKLLFAATERLLLIYSHFIFSFSSSFSPFSLFPRLHTNIATSEKRETLHLVFIMLISLSPALPPPPPFYLLICLSCLLSLAAPFLMSVFRGFSVYQFLTDQITLFTEVT